MKYRIRRTAASVLAILLAAAMLFGGCGKSTGTGKTADGVETTRTSAVADTSQKTSEEKTVVLNDRQKEILAAGGLSADIEDLEPDQIRAILSIERMLSYMEDKYGTTFYYLGYVPAGILEDETLICYA